MNENEWEDQDWREDATGVLDNEDLYYCPNNARQPHCNHYSTTEPCCFCGKYYDGQAD